MNNVVPGTIRLWMPTDASCITTANPYGFFPHILDKGWDGAMGYAPPGLASLDETIAAGYGVCFTWINGQFATGQSPASGKVPADLTGSGHEEPFRCTPRGPEWTPHVEQFLPGLIKAVAKRAAACHAHGQRSGLYTGCPSLTLLAQNMAKATRDARLDALILPWKAAGIDFWALDGAGVIDPQTGESTVDAFYFAERCLFHGILPVVEPHGPVHPRLSRWYDGRMGAVSMHWPESGGYHPQGPGWHNAVNGKGWHGPAWPNASLREHFCWLQGSVPLAERVGLIPPATVNGSRCTGIVEMGDMPREWLGLGVPTAEVS